MSVTNVDNEALIFIYLFNGGEVEKQMLHYFPAAVFSYRFPPPPAMHFWCMCEY